MGVPARRHRPVPREVGEDAQAQIADRAEAARWSIPVTLAAIKKAAEPD
jgi:hypothetical protein